MRPHKPQHLISVVRRQNNKFILLTTAKVSRLLEPVSIYMRCNKITHLKKKLEIQQLKWGTNLHVNSLNFQEKNLAV